MKRSVSFIFVTFLAASSLLADELWSNGCITPEQPFKARVIGVQPGWGWDTIILREIGGERRYCLATFRNPIGAYEVVSSDKFDKGAMQKQGATFVEPAVDVERFSWSMSVWRHGRIFGGEDTATKHHRKTGADKPATSLESKLEGDEKSKSE